MTKQQFEILSENSNQSLYIRLTQVHRRKKNETLKVCFNSGSEENLIILDCSRQVSGVKARRSIIYSKELFIVLADPYAWLNINMHV